MIGFKPTSMQHPEGDLTMKETVESHLRHRIKGDLPGPWAFVIGRARTDAVAARMPELASSFDQSKPEVSLLIHKTPADPGILAFVEGASEALWRAGAKEVSFCCLSWWQPQSESEQGHDCWAAIYLDREGGVDGLLLRHIDREIVDHTPWGEAGAECVQGPTLDRLKHSLMNVRMAESQNAYPSTASQLTARQ